MKKAYLIYEDKEAQKNHGFIEMFQQAGKEKGIDFSFVSKKGSLSDCLRWFPVLVNFRMGWQNYFSFGKLGEKYSAGLLPVFQPLEHERRLTQ